MKNVVTFETSKRLKEAGFPQPEYETGQFWYGDTGKLCVITHAGEYLTGFTVLNGLREIWDLEVRDSDAVFALTATDILRELPEWFSMLTYGNKKFHLNIDIKKAKITSGENAAELLAAAWLSLNEKQSQQ